MSRNIASTILKVLLWFFAGVFIVLIIVVITLQIPAVQQRVAREAVSFLRDKLDTTVQLESISITFPKSVNINGFYLADKNNDTLWYNKSLRIDINMFALLNNKLQINRLELEGGTIHLYRTLADSTFNFDFITEAFTSEKDTTIRKDTTGSDMKFDIDKLIFKNIYFTYLDEVSGTNLSFNIGRFNINADKVDPANSVYLIDNIKIENTFIEILTYKESVKEDTGPIDVNFVFKSIDLTAIDFSFINQINHNTISASIGKTSIKADAIDLPSQTIDLRNVSLFNSEASFIIDKHITVDTIAKKLKDPVTSEEDEIREAGWLVKVRNLHFDSNTFIFINHNETSQHEGIDFANMLVSDINLKVKDFNYSSQKISADINTFSLKEKSGFVLEQLTTKLVYDSTHIELADLKLKTGNSEIGDFIAVTYRDISQIAENLKTTGINADLSNTVISFRDILYFSPQLSSQPPFSRNRGGQVKIDTKLSGTIGNLEIENLQMSTLHNTYIDVRGNATGLPDAENANYNIVIREIVSSRNDINSLVPAKTLPENISIPPQVKLTGFFHGNLNNFRTNLNLNTTYGNAVAQAEVTGGPAENFILSAAIRNFDLGKLLMQDTTFGIVDLNLEAEGSGLKPESMVANYSGMVNKFEFNDYNYNNLEFSGTIIEEMLSAEATLNDSNLIFTLDAKMSLDTANPRYYIDLNLSGADLQALNITSDDLRLSFKFRADLDGYDINKLNGELSMHNVLIVKDKEQYGIDSLLYVSISEDQNNSINLNSDFISGKFEGSIGIFDLPKAIQNHFNQYFPSDIEPVNEPLFPQKFSFQLTIHNPDILSDIIIPELQSIKPGNISGEFDSDKDELNIQISIPHIVYSGINIDTLIIDISSNSENFYFNTHIVHISNATIDIENPTLIITAAQDTIQAIFQIVDEQTKEEKYLIAGNLVKSDERMKLSIIPTGVKLYFDQWIVAEDNYIIFGNNQLYFHNVRISKNDQYILVNNTGEGFSSPVEFSLSDFHLPVLSRIINDKYAIVGGIINGSIIISNLSEESPIAFLADLSIDDFSFKGDTVGQLILRADNETTTRYKMELEIKGYGNDISAQGIYSTLNDKSSIDFDLDIQNLNLSTIESFTLGHLSNMSGGMEGDLRLTGTTDAPDLNGFLQFKDASFNLSYLNSTFTFANERILFNEQGINFNNLTIRDTLNNTANIKGYLYTSHFKDFRFSIDVTTRDFLALNTKEKNDNLYFGTIYLDSDIIIRGDLNRPVVNMTARLKEDSQFTLVLPKDEVAIIERKGVIEFVDYTGKYSKIMTRQDLSEDTIRTELTGIDLNANIEINRDSKLKIVVDEVAGDSLVLYGDASLSFGIDPSGKMSLTGRYEIVEGTYQMTLYVRRKFNIQQGSSLTWTGNPLEARVDITAIYNVRTAPLDLMADQISGTDEAQQNRYRQKLPFHVHLNMLGDLMKPDINFDIELAPEERGGEVGATVTSKLEQLSVNESELNKQVFALLVLERFLPEDPLAIRGGSSGAEGLARESVSRIMGQQLNRLAGKYIQGVELSVGLESYEDYSTGEAEGRTELAVGVSKQFFNERIKVDVGSNFDLEGERARRSNLSTIAGDVSIEYKLTPDGRFRLRGFRESIYEGIIEGEIIETGLGLIYTKDYNTLRDLFRREVEDESFKRRD
jgi:translocation and assembly module TamB